MTTLTMRMIKGHFVVSGPDVEPMKFKSRPEAENWGRDAELRSDLVEAGPPRSPPGPHGFAAGP
jgi:hypothetical protein